MFSSTSIPLHSAGVLNKLVADYLSDKEQLRAFHHGIPTLENFSALIRTGAYEKSDRGLLTETLTAQASLTDNATEATALNILSLKESGTFTITTGHQLCLFTGPLYFIYKILSAINLAEQLQREFPEKKFIPVYWMATEDHDFAEVNHFYVAGKKLQWQSEQKGAVGDFSTGELKTLLPLLREAWGLSANSKYLLDLFENAYIRHQDLKTATRFLVNELFGKYGLVTVDGDDARFKELFITEFESDLFFNAPHQQVEASMKALEELGYRSQVHSREINCFYLGENLRARIEKMEGKYTVAGTDLTFTEEGLKALLGSSPETFSPNVVLRPLYQQKILPNLAYIGGPGELAYWLEFRKMFDEAGIVFPLLVPRTSLTIVDRPIRDKMKKLKLEPADFFMDEKNMLRRLQINEGRHFSTGELQAELKKVFGKLMGEAAAADDTLVHHIRAEEQRTLKRMEAIEQKVNRAIRRKMETETRRIREVKKHLAPGGAPQERVENFSSFYLLYGQEFLEQLKTRIRPLSQEMLILQES